MSPWRRNRLDDEQNCCQEQKYAHFKKEEVQLSVPLKRK